MPTTALKKTLKVAQAAQNSNQRSFHLPLDLIDPLLQKTFAADRANLTKTRLPIVTVSGTYQEDLKGLYGLSESDRGADIVLSRAHYSMALAVAVAAWGKTIDPKRAWIVDPTNYITRSEWSKVVLTQWVGQVLARHPLLKLVKDFVDKFGRSKLPILQSITPPLQFLTQDIRGPVLSLHIAAGNILVAEGKTVVQVVTDPHVREDYLTFADHPNLSYCVFDNATKQELLEKATRLGKYVDPHHVIVTGPPVDPRVVAAKTGKTPWTFEVNREKSGLSTKNRPLRLLLTTGGLGTNKPEIEQILNSLLPILKAPDSPIQLLVYAGTQWDIRESVLQSAKTAGVTNTLITEFDSAHFKIHATLRPTGTHPQAPILKSNLAVIYHPQIVDANELLIQYGFPWADGCITKPSGDMAYDAAAAGCFLLTLAEWGEWEHNIREVFTRAGVATKAESSDLIQQLETLADRGWITTAMQAALNLGSEFTEGAEKIVTEFQKLKPTVK